jgi:hypothetical protein
VRVCKEGKFLIVASKTRAREGCDKGKNRTRKRMIRIRGSTREGQALRCRQARCVKREKTKKTKNK